jgi:hypothetical protein
MHVFFEQMDSDMPGAAPTSGSTPDFDSGAHVAAAVAAAVAEATKVRPHSICHMFLLLFGVQ